MNLLHFALVSELPENQLRFSEVTKVSAAIQKQITRDVAPIWETNATIDAFQRLEDVPLGYWPIIIRDDIEYDGAEGIHLDKDGQPFALVKMSKGWSLTASHEALEMLVDPYGDKLTQGQSPKSDQGKVMFLVEVCDPSEAREYSYTVNGIVVSDFYTPQYFEPTTAGNARYSFTGAITKPRDVLPGGYLSWLDPVSENWWQWVKFDGSEQGEFIDLGKLTARRDGKSLRTLIDMATINRYNFLGTEEKFAALVSVKASRSEMPSKAKAASLRSQINKLVKTPASV